ncbi:MAG TPA: hypothetical protein PKA77_04600 [Chitinophagaceae bacterium]|nr:hypothetical protein [Chitinophagaceae bacterium]
MTKTTNRNTYSSLFNGYKVFLFLIGTLLVIYFFLKESNTTSIEDNKIEKDLRDSPELQLAIINDKTDNPTQVSIRLFSELILSLNEKFKHTNKHNIANALVAGHNIIIKNGKNDTLLEFTTAFNAYTNELSRTTNLSFEESLVMFIKMTYSI